MSSDTTFDVDVARRIGDREIALAFTAGPGLTALLGRSGAGKTTVLHMIAGLLRPNRGHVRVGGATLFDGVVDLPAERRRAGYVFQEPRLFPHRRVRWNLLYGRPDGESEGWPGLDEMVALLGLGALLGRWPATLSGGEARRVAIGRALLSRPRFLLLDEPLASLDAARRAETMTLIERIRDSLALPILYVTHDPGEADRLAAARIMMD